MKRNKEQKERMCDVREMEWERGGERAGGGEDNMNEKRRRTGDKQKNKIKKKRKLYEKRYENLIQ